MIVQPDMNCAPIASGGLDIVLKPRDSMRLHRKKMEEEKDKHLSFPADCMVFFPPYECTEHRMFDEPVSGKQKVVFTTTDLLSAIGNARLLKVDNGVHQYQGSVYTSAGTSFGLAHYVHPLLATIWFSYTSHVPTSESKLVLEKVESAWV